LVKRQNVSVVAVSGIVRVTFLAVAEVKVVRYPVEPAKTRLPLLVTVNLGVPEEEAVNKSLIVLAVLKMAVALPAAIPETLSKPVGVVVPIPTLPVEIAGQAALLTPVAKIRPPIFKKFEVLFAGVPAAFPIIMLLDPVVGE
jgi:hypothetical protein